MTNNIDKRRTYYIVLDTEGQGNVMENHTAIIYDIGFAVVDKTGKVYETRSFVLYDTYVLEKELMKTAYYANKFPKYEKDLKEGARKMVTIFTARRELAEMCKKYNVKAIMAHNARYDYNGLNDTLRYITKSTMRYFFPYDVEIWDTQKMAHDTICKQKTYIKWCQENGYMTKHGTPRPQEKAEVLYRYISGNNEFIEEHTGLADVMIEKEIFSKCMRQHKAMRKSLFNE